MARSRYPRPGHRLAPATLRELLQSPVGLKHPATSHEPGLRLCDLDESSWERFDRPTCEALSAEVLRAVGRAVRTPTLIGQRRLPALPKGMMLADLELEARTLNCLVSAGLHERPQDLQRITIEGVLGLRGFWAKGLVDLLTSLEHVIDHPERRSHRKRQSSILRARTSSQYPRRGHGLAPRALCDILTDGIPDELAAGTPFQGLKLCDLDQRVWDHLRPETIARLAAMIVSRVNVSGNNRAIQQRPLPLLPKGIRLDDLLLENRTYNCLRNQGFDKRPEELGNRTVAELLSIKAFGAKCLVDLLSSLETLCSGGRELDEKLTAEAKALAIMPDAGTIYFSDPRLGPLLRTTDAEANTVRELAQHVVKGRLGPSGPLPLCRQLCEIRQKVRALRGLSLERELIDIFASPDTGGRDRQIISEYYGWDGSGGHTLEALGRKYGLSRERIRQVCVRAIKLDRAEEAFAPVCDRALAFIARRVPCPLDSIEAEFHESGFSECRMPLETALEAAAFLARRPRFQIVPVGDRRLVVGAGNAEAPRTVIQAARRIVLGYGAATIADVAAEVSTDWRTGVEHALVETTLEMLPDFQWLDRKRGWFQLECMPQYGLPNMIEKTLSVAGRIGVSRLRSAVARYRRTGRKVPPTEVLLEFCRRMAGVRVEGKTIVADPQRDWREVLVGVEAGMVEVLTEHGPVMERSAFENRCVANGMNRFSFNAIIMCSPVIAHYGRSVYGLVGAKAGRRTVEALAASKSGTVPAKVLRDYGRTGDGRVFLVYRLSKAAISGGVITVPAAFKQTVRGQFTLRMPDGQPAGVLVSRNGCAWGLGPVLRGRHAEPGDFLRLVFDTTAAEATVAIGDESTATPDRDSGVAVQGSGELQSVPS